MIVSHNKRIIRSLKRSKRKL